ncbi:proteinase-activated receptor 1-like [Periophthalmus magnuspinnatus]|uniref:proteinase-activated receptor 1-like n=1 Tax=Periophthalmus magnuspinnatus TaxID=409849 RepID=UPI00145AEF95|nr:proteinase-activated receptor 1-like [Periophthalmus magnuspinnatus]
MISLFVFVLLTCVHLAPAVVYNSSSGAGPRTFGISYNDAEQLDIDNLFSDYDSGGGKSNASSKMQILSEETILFLSGPMSTLLMPSWYSLVCLISVPVNLCAMLAFAQRIRPKKPAAIYMLNLACADLLFALLLPFKICYHYLGNNWIFGPIMCRVVTAAFYWNMYCSVLLICCISVDRLLAVVYPIDSLAWRRPQNAVIACVTMWILSFIGCTPLLLSNQTIYLDALNITTCHDVQPLEELKWNYKIYFLTICCTLFFLPLLISVVSYTRVIWTLNRVPKGIRGSSRKKTRAVVMAATVLVIFVLCFMPTNCIMLVHYLLFSNNAQSSHQGADSSYALYMVFLCLGSLNCCLDPLVYYFGSSQCQKQLSSVLRCGRGPTVCSTSHSSSDSYKSSRKGILKSSRTESSKINPSSEHESFQAHLHSQYKKLLV